ncbi:hypothetical protein PsorP6_001452 [Peronosclerospora sorghi]|uniref:Uncharacterized protein n=1 Tax=Peronosclerospora sorghi TaxID=230839 RepID=A0ACC0WSZ9_9STRA|nr:hypothetical protein PsorP6_001452 [Peronosclerospora sorghi]
MTRFFRFLTLLRGRHVEVFHRYKLRQVSGQFSFPSATRQHFGTHLHLHTARRVAVSINGDVLKWRIPLCTHQTVFILEDDDELLDDLSEAYELALCNRYLQDRTATPKSHDYVLKYLFSQPEIMFKKHVRTTQNGFRNLVALLEPHPIFHKNSRSTQKKRMSAGGNRRLKYTEGWIEFEDKKVAKRVAKMLNTKQIGGRKRDYYHDDMWNLKYLKGFKWDHLTEKIAYENRIRDQKLRMEILQARKENEAYLERVEQSKQFEKMEARKADKKAKGDEEQAGIQHVRRTFQQKASTSSKQHQSLKDEELEKVFIASNKIENCRVRIQTTATFIPDPEIGAPLGAFKYRAASVERHGVHFAIWLLTLKTITHIFIEFSKREDIKHAFTNVYCCLGNGIKGIHTRAGIRRFPRFDLAIKFSHRRLPKLVFWIINRQGAFNELVCFVATKKVEQSKDSWRL